MATCRIGHFILRRIREYRVLPRSPLKFYILLARDDLEEISKYLAIAFRYTVLRFTIRIWLVRVWPSSAVYFPLPEMQTVTISRVLFQFRSDLETVSGSDRLEHESKRCDSFGIFSNSIRGLKLRSELVMASVQVRGYSIVRGQKLTDCRCRSLPSSFEAGKGSKQERAEITEERFAMI